jgi:hypothetical protein
MGRLDDKRYDGKGNELDFWGQPIYDSFSKMERSKINAIFLIKK